MNQTLIRTQIEVDKSKAKMDVDVINAKAESSALIIANNAQQYIQNNTITYQSMGYSNAKSMIGLSESKSLLDFIFYLNLMNLAKSDTQTKVIVGLDNAIINMNKN